jgi:O-antigen/teichoic acid export membrane protein
MLAALAKLGSPEMVGQFALGVAVTAPIIVLSNLQLRAVQATDARGEYTFESYFGLRMLTTALALIAIAALISVGRYATQTAVVILLVGIAKAIESISDVYFGLLQRHERMRYIAISLILKGLLSLPALALGVFFTRSVTWGVAGMAIAWACVLLFYDVPVARRLGIGTPHFHWQPAVFARLTLLSLPLGFVMLLISLNSNIPRYFIERFHGQRELGIYAALAYIPIAVNAVVNALGQAISPRLAGYYAERKAREYVTLLGKATLAGIALGAAMLAVAAVAGDRILAILYDSQYAGQGSAFLLLMAAGAVGFVASFLGFGATAARYFRVQFPLFGCMALTTLVACIYLVPRQGATGAALALLAAATVQLVLTAAVIVHAVGEVSHS